MPNPSLNMAFHCGMSSPLAVLQGEIAAPTPLMVEGFLLELLRAVKVCRGHNIAHKDLKPANLIVKLEHAALIRPIVSPSSRCRT